MHQNQCQKGDTQQLSRMIYAAIEDAARSVLDANRAEQKSTTMDSDVVIRLEPQNRSAAPLEVSIDTKYLVTCFPGHSGMTVEMFSKDPAEIEQEVRNLAKAVIKGRYSERVNDRGRRTKIVARWPGECVNEKVSLNILCEPKRDVRGWRTVAYSPY